MKTARLLNRYDLFKTPVYSFNIEGSDGVGSGIGFICSLVVIMITLAFSSIKML